MATAVRALAEASRVFHRQAREVGEEFREARLSLGLSQEHVARAARIHRNRCGRIENGRCANVTVAELDKIAAVLGLSASVRVFSGGRAVRDGAHSGKLLELLRLIVAPLRYRVEVSLPATGGWEPRAWDAMLFGRGRRTAIELEMRLRDVQALRRRLDLKRRDDPAESFLLLIADTRNNRRVLADFGDLFADLPRLRPSVVRAALAAGEHPPTGLLLT